jgi:hypothetical protein
VLIYLVIYNELRPAPSRVHVLFRNESVNIPRNYIRYASAAIMRSWDCALPHLNPIFPHGRMARQSGRLPPVRNPIFQHEQKLFSTAILFYYAWAVASLVIYCPDTQWSPLESGPAHHLIFVFFKGTDEKISSKTCHLVENGVCTVCSWGCRVFTILYHSAE